MPQEASTSLPENQQPIEIRQEAPQPSAPQIDSLESNISTPQTGPVGVGGWLILPILHLVTSIGLTAKNILEVNREDWTFLLTNTKPEALHIQFLALLSTFSAICFIGWSGLCLVQMFRRSPRLPRNMIIFYSAAVITTIFDSALIQYFASITGDLAEPVAGGLARVFIGAAIWIPYFRVSKRVKNTFRAHDAKISQEINNIFA